VLKNKVEVIRELGDLPMITAPRRSSIRCSQPLHQCGTGHGKPGQLRIKTWHADDAVHISVTDNGKGIPQEKPGAHLRPVFTTKRWAKAPGWDWPSHTRSSSSTAGDSR